MAKLSATDVSALRILNGERLAGPPSDLGNIGVCQAKSGRGVLYVLVNAQGESHTAMEKRLVATIVDVFQQSQNSITGALLDAIKAANHVLYEDNRMSFGAQRVQAGVYCALVRPGQDVVLAYIGPAIALLVGSAGVERMFSDVDPALARSAGRAASLKDGLGIRQDIEVSFYSCAFNPGDMLVLASPELLECGFDDEELANALTEDGTDSLPDDTDVTVMMIKYATGPARSAVTDRGPAPVAAPVARTSIMESVTGLLKRKPAAQTQDDAAPPAETSPVAPVQPAAPSPRPADVDIPPWLEGGPDAVRSSSPTPRSRLRLPSLHLPRLAIAPLQIGALVGVVLLIVCAFWWQARVQAQAREQRFQNLIAEAEQKRTLGQASLDRTQALGYLKDADALALEALAVKPDAPEVGALRDGILRDMDVAKGVVRLTTAQLTTLYTFTATGTAPDRVVGDGANLYVLDKGDQKVYRFIVTAQGNGVQSAGDPVIVRKGDQVGGRVVADILDIAWVPEGGNRKTANLLILDSGGTLLQYDTAKGLSVLPVNTGTAWRKVQSTGGYSGNFYVLDNLADTILRYRAGARGYEDAPSPYLLTKVDLTSAVDMAIDGDIFVLMVNGQIHWLSGGRPQTYSIEGLDRPLSAPVAIFTNEGSQSVYVSDPSNSRVVVFGKQGGMQKQFVYEDNVGTFQRLRGVFADEKKLSLYVTAGTKLFHIAMPK